MSVNKENYGAWIVDYYDGKLSHTEARKLLLFLEAHPDYKAEFEAYETVSLPEMALSFPDKDKIKHNEIIPVGHLDETHYQKAFMEAHDGSLDPVQAMELEAFLKKNPFLKEEYEQFGKLYLPVDDTLVFTEKESLKHRPVLIPFIRNGVLAAAAVFLLFMGFRFFKPGQVTPPNHPHAMIDPMRPTNVQSSAMSLRVYPDTRLINKQFPVNKAQVTPVKNEIRLAAIRVMSPRKIGDAFPEPPVYAGLRLPFAKMNYTSTQIVRPLVVEQHRRGPVRRVLSGALGKFDRLLAKARRTKRQKGESEKGWVKVIDSGVMAFNKFTDSDNLVMVKTYDHQGKLLAFDVMGNGLHFQKKMKGSSSAK